MLLHVAQSEIDDAATDECRDPDGIVENVALEKDVAECLDGDESGNDGEKTLIFPPQHVPD